MTDKHDPIQETSVSEIWQSPNSGKIKKIRVSNHFKVSPIFGSHLVVLLLIRNNPFGLIVFVCHFKDSQSSEEYLRTDSTMPLDDIPLLY